MYTQSDAVPQGRGSFAHTLNGRPPAEWEPLERHLEAVAGLAADYAGVFGARAWGEVLGYWHDLGKYSDAFQDYLRRSADPDASEGDGESAGRVDHSTFGAQYADRTVGGHRGRLLAFCIAGHHAGLTDATADEEASIRSALERRLAAGPPRVPAVTLPKSVAPPPALAMPFRPDQENPGFPVAFFARMLFSCLVDADRTATEAFCQPEAASERAQPKPSMAQLCSALEASLDAKLMIVESSPVNRVRASILRDCRAAASEAPGFFSLLAPTGGGKTLSSLAFALNHAVRHGLRRVVVAIPFTSVIEQTADAYRHALGPLAARGLIEHHTAIDPAKQTRANEMAAENWDAPLIVTTNVQLFESLFACATTPCRKLHRLARSVIVLDEAQTVPVELLNPTLAALRELVSHYGCSVVMCTATQPALERRDGFDIGIEGMRAIIRDAPSLFNALRRVEVKHAGVLQDADLADRLAAESRVLCIVNTRAQAARLYGEMVDRIGIDGSFHLSTYMCAQHRRETLAEIRRRLAGGSVCRLVSTQLVEAGVDLDFPVVYRAPTGFDGIAQAAGRCNREGKLHRGALFLFDMEPLPPAGMLRQTAQTARELLPRFPDPLDPTAVEAYFRQFYWSQAHRWDALHVAECFSDDLRRTDLSFKFRTAASRYRVIRDEQTPILVAYDEEARQIRHHLLTSPAVDFRILRAAQRYMVGVRDTLLTALTASELVTQHDSGMFLLLNDSAYSPDTGLNPAASGISAELLVQ